MRADPEQLYRVLSNLLRNARQAIVATGESGEISIHADEDERTCSCVVFHFVDGMTHDEVGALLGISGAAVRKRIRTFRLKVQANPPEWMSPEEDG